MISRALSFTARRPVASAAPVAAALVALAAVACGGAAGDAGGTEASASEAAPDNTATAFRSGLDFLGPMSDALIIQDFFSAAAPIDGIKPIYEPKYLSAQAAQDAGLAVEELVMGVSINGESKAFPVGLLAVREMLNDTIGGVPILATWCPICFTGIVHDRRLDGEILTFGNFGKLFMNAQTWWDHGTKSVWAQPWGAAIDGPLKGRSLEVVGFDLVPWQTWLDQHPDTLVLTDERPHSFGIGGLLPREDFIIGLSIGDAAKGFYSGSVRAATVVNERVGEFPVAVFMNKTTRKIAAYFRDGIGTPADHSVEAPAEVNFRVGEDGTITDLQTGSVWDLERGLAVEGPLRGAAIQHVPFMSSWAWAWTNFHPGSEFWGSPA